MKKILALVFLALALTGCAALKQGYTDGKDCWNDDKCREQAIAQAEKVKVQVTGVAGVVSPIPWVPVVAGSVGGSLAFVVSLVLGGRKKREEVSK